MRDLKESNLAKHMKRLAKEWATLTGSANYTVVEHFEILRAGWELDFDAWVIRGKDNTHHAVTTNHNTPYFATQQELLKLLENYHEASRKTEIAIRLMRKTPTS